MPFEIQTCPSPALFDTYITKEDKPFIAVIIDVLRASSVICTALAHGAKNIIPVLNVEEAEKYRSDGLITAAERGGQKVKGFLYGNSPFDYIDNARIKNQSIVITTTNGTKAIQAATESAECIAIGCFLNLSSICEWVSRKEMNVLLVCAGWKDKYNLEDSLAAGAMASVLLKNSNYQTTCDCTLSSVFLYDHGKSNISSFLENSSHNTRLSGLDRSRDVEYCLVVDELTTVPYLMDGRLVSESKSS